MSVTIESDPAMRAYKLDEFCRTHSISRASVYNLWAKGRGPKVIRLGPGPKSALVIPVEAAEEWRRANTTDFDAS